MAEINLNFLKELSETGGVSGREKKVRERIKNEIEPYCDDVQVDSIGNLIASKAGSGKKLLLLAPMDEVGFIISDIKKGGGAFLSFMPVGRIRPRTVISESVVVGDEEISGVVSLKAVHLTTKEEREKPVALSSLYIDIGADKKSDVEKCVTIGDYAVFKSRFTELGGGYISNKAIGSRACCAVLAEVLKQDFSADVTVVFTAQRQVGSRGAKLWFDSENNAACDFDAAIILDTIEEKDVKCGLGAVLPLMVNETVPDRSLVNSLKNCGDARTVAKKAQGGDIAEISIKGTGILSAELDIPTYNKNTASEILCMNDVNAELNVLLNYIENL